MDRGIARSTNAGKCTVPSAVRRLARTTANAATAISAPNTRMPAAMRRRVEAPRAKTVISA
jgi:hypothetical protein